MKRQLILGVLVVGLLLGTAGVAFAYGAANHYSNGIKHGCPGDNGCYGSTNYYGDYNRSGYMRKDTTGNASELYTSIWRIPNNTLYSQGQCFNCKQVWVDWDTNPHPECDYRTWHYAVTPTVSGHNHWTESATSSSGCPF